MTIKITADSLKGYILEEVLAYLIRTTGYKLLVDRDQDPEELDWRPNGLVVKGRGGNHQVDVLGELQWIPAFTFPLRLFVEAKFRNSKTGIGAVRNAIGVLLDINQKYSGIQEQGVLQRYYRYVYALFSASGFSGNATRMALAYQISLIDLSSDEFKGLRNRIIKAAGDILIWIEEGGFGIGEGYGRGKLVVNVRNIMRHELHTWPEGVQSRVEYDMSELRQIVKPVVGVAQNYGELFVAMAKGPFMLLLKADKPDRFVEYANTHPRHRVNIMWSRQIDGGETWFITPRRDRGAYTLSFRLPEALSKWIFAEADLARRRALLTKQTYFSDITIYRYIDGKDYLYRLEYAPEGKLEDYKWKQ